MSQTIASLDRVTKVYRKPGAQVSIPALAGIDLCFDQGEYIAICGASGSGKSTMLNLLGCLDRPTSGRYVLGGQDVSQLDDNTLSEIRSTRLGFVFQNFNLIAQLTVLENLKLAAYAVSDREELQRNFQRVFSLFPRLEERKRQPGETLSGGEQQMLAVARALMTGGKLMLLDEPSMGLAPVLMQELFRVLKEINQEGVTILLVEQNAKLALKAATRGYVLEKGRIVLQGSGEELLANSEVRKIFLGEN